MERIPIALQLYSIREDCAKDLPGCLKAVAGMGYEGVEFAGYHGFDAVRLKTMLDDLGLKCAGAHTGIDQLAPDRLVDTMEFHRTLGNEFLIVPGLPGEYTSSADAWKKTAQLFNEISEKVKPEGFHLGYHNHHIEFQPLDGQIPWDIFFSNTSADITMQLDTGNALVGGADAAEFLPRYPGRALTVHLKEHSATNDKALIGEGDVDWQKIFHLCETVGRTRWYIVEQESYAFPPMECVDKCLQALKAMGK